MKSESSGRWLFVASLIVLVAYILAGNLPSSGEEKTPAKVTKWEYKVFPPLDDKDAFKKLAKFEDVANALGEEGWELAAVASPQVIFKRPKR